jgi:hypothetical protein
MIAGARRFIPHRGDIERPRTALPIRARLRFQFDFCRLPSRTLSAADRRRRRLRSDRGLLGGRWVVRTRLPRKSPPLYPSRQLCRDATPMCAPHKKSLTPGQMHPKLVMLSVDWRGFGCSSKGLHLPNCRP